MSEPRLVCSYCSSDEFPRVAVVTRTGERMVVCQDGTACLRRRMARAGIKLRPHPKNPVPNTGDSPK